MRYLMVLFVVFFSLTTHVYAEEQSRSTSLGTGLPTLKTKYERKELTPTSKKENMEIESEEIIVPMSTKNSMTTLPQTSSTYYIFSTVGLILVALSTLFIVKRKRQNE
ncbi:LPXTG cell wall anchor domain-containing protein [Kurthia zopfii]|uniref:LPXTG cell wall anchor domain-containing protein n=1 Tax=Kurthia zopfii TaxID=1650 RepID=UPI000F6F3250|nr:LPXTG cell wall anchor domain-containing protein [Kurthia zopfii]VEI07404.1 Gram positive anchor [Kurthia zopfii]